ncbi:transaldolase [Streptomyces silvisoli]|uniref:Transaldolase n=1 Tax=Streptomyces silvisoli TaxID=3034235 RepID=A0ABT5ZQW7_9ACTN|nr:transaldolase [Streptomyces silvisoli]MDF3292219.1 transaldolase [Streptomyces silvisoli]
MKDPAAVASGGDLHPLIAEGVSPWVEGVHRSLIVSGCLARLIKDAGVRGAVCDPGTLAEAVTGDPVYRDQLVRLAYRGATVGEALRALQVHDAREACDELNEVFEKTQGHDGQVSVDLDPGLCHDAAATTRAAAELWRALDRPNALVKIPATIEGLAAIRDCLGRGISVHATGIFSVARYRETVDAYFDGMERALAEGERLSAIASLASFPVSWLDTEVDVRLDELRGLDEPTRAAARTVRGTAALTNARLMYQVYEERLGSERWRALRAAGARPQRLMWSDTAVRDPERPGTGYVDGIVAWGTVSAMTLPTLEAAVHHCDLRGDTLMGEQDSAKAALGELERLGISYETVVRKAATDSEARLAAAWRALREAVATGLHI